MTTTRRVNSSTFDSNRPLAGRLPPLTMLRAFEAAARTGSMRQAADDIGISHTVVSRHIKNLETWIGCKLIDAGPRGVTLNAEGQSLYSVTSGAFQAIADTAGQIRFPALEDDLRIWCVPGLATRWLTPRLRAIRRAIGADEVLLRATDQVPDLTLGEADLMIGFGPFDELPHRAIPLIQPRMFPVVSPDWLRRHGRPQSIEALRHLPLIHEESHAQWMRWFRRAGVEVSGSLTGPRLWDANLGFDAAMAGQGVALTSAFLVANEVADGRLVELFRTDIRLGGYYLLPAAPAGTDWRVDRFVAWIEAAMKDVATEPRT